MRIKTFILIIALFALTGCGSVISKELLRDIDRSVTLEEVQASPDAYKGRKVVWGGTIISSENLESATEITVLESALSWDDTPADGQSRGRFIIEAKKYLDTAIFKEGKRVTVAGIVKGIEVRKIGKMDYRYPVITPLEIKLYEPPPKTTYMDTLPPYWYSPYPYNYPYPYYPYPWPYPYPPPPGYPYPYMPIPPFPYNLNPPPHMMPPPAK